MKIRKKIMGILLSITMVLGLVPGMCLTAYADGVSVGNNGYPYGKDMGDSYITLVCEATGGTSYQWQSSNSEDGEFTDIEGATSSEYTFTPTNCSWYRCKVGGTASKAVQAIKPSGSGSASEDGRIWTCPFTKWYLTNGKVAYTIDGSVFDVVGQYKKGDNMYMLGTTCYSGWGMYVEENNTSPAKTVFYFNDVAVMVNVTIADNTSNFAFGCDTMLGNGATSGSYSDSAALVAALNDDKSLKHIAMVGAEHVNEETDENAPAFVIEPVGNPMFWIGAFSLREVYKYNTETDVNWGKEQVKEHNGTSLTDAVTRVEKTDSGMTMSWKGVKSVQFSFKVGTAKETGAVKGNVNYLNDTIDGLEANMAYTVEVKDAEGNTTAKYSITSNKDGSIPLQGTDTDGTDYDLTGKTIQISKVGSEDTPAELDIKPRPSEDKDEPGTENYAKPEDITEAEVDRTQTTITLTPSGEFKQTQQYRIYNADGSEIDGQDWMAIDNGTVTISNLSPGTDYLIRAYVPATATTPRSYISDGTSITTMADSVVTKAPEAKTLEYSGSSQALVTTGTATGGTMYYALGTDAATAPSAEKFAATIPTAVNVGSYYVWYKVVGDSNHFDTEAKCIKSIIKEQPKEEPKETPKDVDVTPEVEENTEDNSSEEVPTETQSPYRTEWVDGQWYDSEGNATYKPQGKWYQDSTGWWYQDTSGWYPSSQWQKIDGKWYYFTSDGYMDYSEYRDGFWLGSDGAWVETYYGGGWGEKYGQFWYEDATGWYPVSQWLWINGKCYYFGSDGYRVYNQYVDGYWVNNDGEWEP